MRLKSASSRFVHTSMQLALAVSAGCTTVCASGVTITEFPVTAAIANPAGAGPLSIAVGPDGNLWFTESTGGGIGRSDPAGNVTVFQVPGPYPPGVFGPTAIASGADGNLWFTDATNNRIGRITTSGVFTMFPIPTANAEPDGITSGPDGNVWFTEKSASQIAKISPAGLITEYPTTTSGSSPAGITAAGGNLYFTETSTGFIGAITPDGLVTELPGSGALQGSIATGQDQSIWFTTPGIGVPFGCPRGPGAVVAWNPAGTPQTALIIEDGIGYSQPYGIVGDPSGSVWFTDQWGNDVGYGAPGGAIVQFPIPTQASHPSDIVVGPDGNIWFTETTANKIGRVNWNEMFADGFE